MMFSSVRSRVLLAAGSAIVGILLVFVFANVAFQSTSGLTDRMVSTEFRLVRIVGDLGIQMGNLRRYEKDVLINQDNKEEVEKYLTRWKSTLVKANESLSLAKKVSDNAELSMKVDEISKNLSLYGTGFPLVVGQVLEGKLTSASEGNRAMGPYKEPIRKMEGLLLEVMESASKGTDIVVGQVAEKQSFALILMAVSTLIFATISLLITGRVTKSLLAELGGEPEMAASVAREIAQGNLSVRVQVLSGDKASILAAMSQMQSYLQSLIGDIQKVVVAAEKGDLSQRVDIRGREGFGLEIGNALNRLVQVSDTSLQDIARVSTALAAGKLEHRIESSYPGTFGQTANAVNATVDSLKTVIEDIRRIVDAASRGDFSLHMEATSRSGYPKMLAELLNSLNDTANEALSDISRVAQSLAEGNLRQEVTKHYPGLFGETAEAINATVSNLQSLIRGVVEAVETINTASQEISSGNHDLSVRTEEQASSLEETASSMEQVTSMVQQNSQSAFEVSKRAKTASAIASNGGGVVKATVVTMDQIQESSRKIRDIISVIDGIAFQTNILALNAAVEAARAGEQGKGFAVVATEVRSLAQRSAQAAKEIASLISDSVDKVERGTAQAVEAGRTMDEIVLSIGQVTEIAVGISDASKEQATGIEEVSRAVAQMDQGIQQNAALVEQAAAAAESLAEQAQQLQAQVQAFRL
jgi:methyl-accepting chemotaxis protein